MLIIESLFCGMDVYFKKISIENDDGIENDDDYEFDSL
jgi:hypothetical protein